MSIKITTNHVPRFPVYGYELTTRERHALGLPPVPDESDESDAFAEFVRYRGNVIPINDFSADWGITRGTGLPSPFAGWDGYLSDTYFSGLVIRYVRDGDRIDTDRVVIGRFFASDD